MVQGVAHGVVLREVSAGVAVHGVGDLRGRHAAGQVAVHAVDGGLVVGEDAHIRLVDDTVVVQVARLQGLGLEVVLRRRPGGIDQDVVDDRVQAARTVEDHHVCAGSRAGQVDGVGAGALVGVAGAHELQGLVAAAVHVVQQGREPLVVGLVHDVAGIVRVVGQELEHRLVHAVPALALGGVRHGDGRVQGGGILQGEAGGILGQVGVQTLIVLQHVGLAVHRPAGLEVVLHPAVAVGHAGGGGLDDAHDLGLDHRIHIRVALTEHGEEVHALVAVIVVDDGELEDLGAVLGRVEAEQGVGDAARAVAVGEGAAVHPLRVLHAVLLDDDVVLAVVAVGVRTHGLGVQVDGGIQGVHHHAVVRELMVQVVVVDVVELLAHMGVPRLDLRVLIGAPVLGVGAVGEPGHVHPVGQVGLGLARQQVAGGVVHGADLVELLLLVVLVVHEPHLLKVLRTVVLARVRAGVLGVGDPDVLEGLGVQPLNADDVGGRQAVVVGAVHRQVVGQLGMDGDEDVADPLALLQRHVDEGVQVRVRPRVGVVEVAVLVGQVVVLVVVDHAGVLGAVAVLPEVQGGELGGHGQGGGVELDLGVKDAQTFQRHLAGGQSVRHDQLVVLVAVEHLGVVDDARVHVDLFHTVLIGVLQVEGTPTAHGGQVGAAGGLVHGSAVVLGALLRLIEGRQVGAAVGLVELVSLGGVSGLALVDAVEQLQVDAAVRTVDGGPDHPDHVLGDVAAHLVGDGDLQQGLEVLVRVVLLAEVHHDLGLGRHDLVELLVVVGLRILRAHVGAGEHHDLRLLVEVGRQPGGVHPVIQLQQVVRVVRIEVGAAGDGLLLVLEARRQQVALRVGQDVVVLRAGEHRADLLQGAQGLLRLIGAQVLQLGERDGQIPPGHVDRVAAGAVVGDLLEHLVVGRVARRLQRQQVSARRADEVAVGVDVVARSQRVALAVHAAVALVDLVIVRVGQGDHHVEAGQIPRQAGDGRIVVVQRLVGGRGHVVLDVGHGLLREEALEGLVAPVVRVRGSGGVHLVGQLILVPLVLVGGDPAGLAGQDAIFVRDGLGGVLLVDYVVLVPLLLILRQSTGVVRIEGDGLRRVVGRDPARLVGLHAVHVGQRQLDGDGQHLLVAGHHGQLAVAPGGVALVEVLGLGRHREVVLALVDGAPVLPLEGVEGLGTVHAGHLEVQVVQDRFAGGIDGELILADHLVAAVGVLDDPEGQHHGLVHALFVLGEGEVDIVAGGLGDGEAVAALVVDLDVGGPVVVLGLVRLVATLGVLHVGKDGEHVALGRGAVGEHIVVEFSCKGTGVGLTVVLVQHDGSQLRAGDHLVGVLEVTHLGRVGGVARVGRQPGVHIGLGVPHGLAVGVVLDGLGGVLGVGHVDHIGHVLGDHGAVQPGAHRVVHPDVEPVGVGGHGQTHLEGGGGVAGGRHLGPVAVHPHLGALAVHNAAGEEQAVDLEGAVVGGIGEGHGLGRDLHPGADGVVDGVHRLDVGAVAHREALEDAGDVVVRAAGGDRAGVAADQSQGVALQRSGGGVGDHDGHDEGVVALGQEDFHLAIGVGGLAVDGDGHPVAVGVGIVPVGRGGGDVHPAHAVLDVHIVAVLVGGVDQVGRQVLGGAVGLDLPHRQSLAGHGGGGDDLLHGGLLLLVDRVAVPVRHGIAVAVQHRLHHRLHHHFAVAVQHGLAELVQLGLGHGDLLGDLLGLGVGGVAQLHDHAVLGLAVDGQGVDADVVGVAALRHRSHVVEVHAHDGVAGVQLHRVGDVEGLAHAAVVAAHQLHDALVLPRVAVRSGVGVHHPLTDGFHVHRLRVVGHGDVVVHGVAVEGRGHGALVHAQELQHGRLVALGQADHVDDVAHLGLGHVAVGVHAVGHELDVVLVAHAQRDGDLTPAAHLGGPLGARALDAPDVAHVDGGDAQLAGVHGGAVGVELLHLVGHQHIIVVDVGGEGREVRDQDQVLLFRPVQLGVDADIGHGGLGPGGRLLGLGVAPVEDHGVVPRGHVGNADGHLHGVVAHHQVHCLEARQDVVGEVAGGDLLAVDGQVVIHRRGGVGRLVGARLGVQLHRPGLVGQVHVVEVDLRVEGRDGAIAHRLVIGVAHLDGGLLRHIGHGVQVGLGAVDRDAVLLLGHAALLLAHHVARGVRQVLDSGDPDDEADVGLPVGQLGQLVLPRAVAAHPQRDGHVHRLVPGDGIDGGQLDQDLRAVLLLGTQGGGQLQMVVEQVLHVANLKLRRLAVVLRPLVHILLGVADRVAVLIPLVLVGIVVVAQEVVDQLAVPDGGEVPAGGVIHPDNVAAVHPGLAVVGGADEGVGEHVGAAVGVRLRVAGAAHFLNVHHIGGVVGHVDLHLVGPLIGHVGHAGGVGDRHGLDGDGDAVAAGMERDGLGPQLAVGHVVQELAAHAAHPQLGDHIHAGEDVHTGRLGTDGDGGGAGLRVGGHEVVVDIVAEERRGGIADHQAVQPGVVAVAQVAVDRDGAEEGVHPVGGLQHEPVGVLREGQDRLLVRIHQVPGGLVDGGVEGGHVAPVELVALLSHLTEEVDLQLAGTADRVEVEVMVAGVLVLSGGGAGEPCAVDAQVVEGRVIHALPEVVGAGHVLLALGVLAEVQGVEVAAADSAVRPGAGNGDLHPEGGLLVVQLRHLDDLAGHVRAHQLLDLALTLALVEEGGDDDAVGGVGVEHRLQLDLVGHQVGHGEVVVEVVRVEDRREVVIVVVIRVGLAAALVHLDVPQLGGVGIGPAADGHVVGAAGQTVLGEDLDGHPVQAVVQHHVGQLVAPRHRIGGGHGLLHAVLVLVYQGGHAVGVGLLGHQPIPGNDDLAAVGQGDVGGAQHIGCQFLELGIAGGAVGQQDRGGSPVAGQDGGEVDGADVAVHGHVVAVSAGGHVIGRTDGHFLAGGALHGRQVYQVGLAAVTVDVEHVEHARIRLVVGVVLDVQRHLHIGHPVGDLEGDHVVGGEVVGGRGLVGLVAVGHHPRGSADADPLLIVVVGLDGADTDGHFRGAPGHAHDEGAVDHAGVRHDAVGRVQVAGGGVHDVLVVVRRLVPRLLHVPFAGPRVQRVALDGGEGQTVAVHLDAHQVAAHLIEPQGVHLVLHPAGGDLVGAVLAFLDLVEALADDAPVVVQVAVDQAGVLVGAGLLHEAVGESAARHGVGRHVAHGVHRDLDLHPDLRGLAHVAHDLHVGHEGLVADGAVLGLVLAGTQLIVGVHQIHRAVLAVLGLGGDGGQGARDGLQRHVGVVFLGHAVEDRVHLVDLQVLQPQIGVRAVDADDVVAGGAQLGGDLDAEVVGAHVQIHQLLQIHLVAADGGLLAAVAGALGAEQREEGLGVLVVVVDVGPDVDLVHRVGQFVGVGHHGRARAFALHALVGRIALNAHLHPFAVRLQGRVVGQDVVGGGVLLGEAGAGHMEGHGDAHVVLTGDHLFLGHDGVVHLQQDLGGILLGADDGLVGIAVVHGDLAVAEGVRVGAVVDVDLQLHVHDAVGLPLVAHIHVVGRHQGVGRGGRGGAVGVDHRFAAVADSRGEDDPVDVVLDHGVVHGLARGVGERIGALEEQVLIRHRDGGAVVAADGVGPLLRRAHGDERHLVLDGLLRESVRLVLNGLGIVALLQRVLMVGGVGLAGADGGCQLGLPALEDQLGLLLQVEGARPLQSHQVGIAAEDLQDLRAVLIGDLGLVVVGIELPGIRLEGVMGGRRRGVDTQLALVVLGHGIVEAVVQDAAVEVLVGEGYVVAGVGLRVGRVDHVEDPHVVQIHVQIHIVDDDQVVSGRIAAGGRLHGDVEVVQPVVQAADPEGQQAGGSRGEQRVVDPFGIVRALGQHVAVLVIGRAVPDQIAVVVVDVDLVPFAGQGDVGGGLGGLDLDHRGPGGVIHHGGGGEDAGGGGADGGVGPPEGGAVQGQVLFVHADEVQPLVQGVLADHGVEGLLLAAQGDGNGHPGLRAEDVHRRVGGKEILLGGIAAFHHGVRIAGHQRAHREQVGGHVAEGTLGLVVLVLPADVQGELGLSALQLISQVAEGGADGHGGLGHLVDDLIVQGAAVDQLLITDVVGQQAVEQAFLLPVVGAVRVDDPLAHVVKLQAVQGVGIVVGRAAATGHRLLYRQDIAEVAGGVHHHRNVASDTDHQVAEVGLTVHDIPGVHREGVVRGDHDLQREAHVALLHQDLAGEHMGGGGSAGGDLQVVRAVQDPRLVGLHGHAVFLLDALVDRHAVHVHAAGDVHEVQVVASGIAQLDGGAGAQRLQVERDEHVGVVIVGLAAHDVHRGRVGAQAAVSGGDVRPPLVGIGLAQPDVLQVGVHAAVEQIHVIDLLGRPVGGGDADGDGALLGAAGLMARLDILTGHGRRPAVLRLELDGGGGLVGDEVEVGDVGDAGQLHGKVAGGVGAGILRALLILAAGGVAAAAPAQVVPGPDLLQVGVVGIAAQLQLVDLVAPAVGGLRHEVDVGRPVQLHGPDRHGLTQLTVQLTPGGIVDAHHGGVGTGNTLDMGALGKGADDGEVVVHRLVGAQTQTGQRGAQVFLGLIGVAALCGGELVARGGILGGEDPQVQIRQGVHHVDLEHRHVHLVVHPGAVRQIVGVGGGDQDGIEDGVAHLHVPQIHVGRVAGRAEGHIPAGVDKVLARLLQNGLEASGGAGAAGDVHGEEGSVRGQHGGVLALAAVPQGLEEVHPAIPVQIRAEAGLGRDHRAARRDEDGVQGVDAPVLLVLRREGAVLLVGPALGVALVDGLLSLLHHRTGDDQVTVFVDGQLGREIGRLGGPVRLHAHILQVEGVVLAADDQDVVAGMQVRPVGQVGHPDAHIEHLLVHGEVHRHVVTDVVALALAHLVVAVAAGLQLIVAVAGAHEDVGGGDVVALLVDQQVVAVLSGDEAAGGHVVAVVAGAGGPAGGVEGDGIAEGAVVLHVEQLEVDVILVGADVQSHLLGGGGHGGLDLHGGVDHLGVHDAVLLLVQPGFLFQDGDAGQRTVVGGPLQLQGVHPGLHGSGIAEQLLILGADVDVHGGVAARGDGEGLLVLALVAGGDGAFHAAQAHAAVAELRLGADDHLGGGAVDDRPEQGGHHAHIHHVAVGVIHILPQRHLGAVRPGRVAAVGVLDRAVAPRLGHGVGHAVHGGGQRPRQIGIGGLGVVGRAVDHLGVGIQAVVTEALGAVGIGPDLIALGLLAVLRPGAVVQVAVLGVGIAHLQQVVVDGAVLGFHRHVDVVHRLLGQELDVLPAVLLIGLEVVHVPLQGVALVVKVHAVIVAGVPILAGPGLGHPLDAALTGGGLACGRVYVAHTHLAGQLFGLGGHTVVRSAGPQGVRGGGGQEVVVHRAAAGHAVRL